MFSILKTALYDYSFTKHFTAGAIMDTGRRRIVGPTKTVGLAVCVTIGLISIFMLTLQGYLETGETDSRSGLQAEGELARLASARELGSRGNADSDAIPELINLLNTDSSKVASTAAWALGNTLSSNPRCTDSLRSKAATSLTNALQHKDSEVRRYAAYALSQNPSVARSAIPELTALLKDPNAAYVAARALGEIGADARGAMPNLAALLKGSNPGHRAEAAMAISKLQPLPKEIIMAITELLEDEVDFVRAAAHKALENIDRTDVQQ